MKSENSEINIPVFRYVSALALHFYPILIIVLK